MTLEVELLLLESVLLIVTGTLLVYNVREEKQRDPAEGRGKGHKGPFTAGILPLPHGFNA